MAGWIVVVDDDVINIKTAGNILSNNNMRVTGIRSGAALLDFIKENDPDLILLDIMMPDMDGYETFRRLRIVEKELGRDETPVVFLTADSDIDRISCKGYDVNVLSGGRTVLRLKKADKGCEELIRWAKVYDIAIENSDGEPSGSVKVLMAV